MYPFAPAQQFHFTGKIKKEQSQKYKENVLLKTYFCYL